MSSKSKPEPQQQQIDLSSLTAQNLTAVKKQLDEELEHLTASFQKLRAAQARFRECIKSVKDGVETQSEGIVCSPSKRRTTGSIYNLTYTSSIQNANSRTTK